MWICGRWTLSYIDGKRYVDWWNKIFEGPLNMKECLCGFVEGRIRDNTEHQKI